MKNIFKDFKKMPKVCNDKPSVGSIKNEWKYDAEDKIYLRIEDGKVIRKIKGSSLPDPEKLFIKRNKTAELLTKHISPEKMQEIIDVAILENKNPEDEILNQLQIRTEPSKATQALWGHWQGVKNAN